MTPSIAVQTLGPASAFRPIFYRIQSGVTNLEVRKVFVEVFINGSNVAAAKFRNDYTSKTGSSNAYDYMFEVDVQAVVRDFLEPFSGKKTKTIVAFSDAKAECSESVVLVQCTFVIEFVNAQNLLERDTTFLTSNQVAVFNIARQHNEGQSLQPYLTNVSRLLLTDNPGTSITNADALSIQAICKQGYTSAILVILTKKDGTNSLHTSYLTSSIADDSGVISVGVGPRQWANHVWYQVAPVIDLNTASVTIGFGEQDDQLPIPVWYSNQITFEVADCNPASFRLHWLNSRGGSDAYTFAGRKSKNVEAKSTVAERALLFDSSAYTHEIAQRGALKVSVSRTDSYDLESQIESEVVAEWLAGVMSSPEVYLELPDVLEYIPVIVLDGSVTTADTEQVGMIVKIKVSLANDFITHTY